MVIETLPTNEKRRISLEDDFMNKKTDDLLFGLMYYLSTYHPSEEILYLTKRNFGKYKRQIYQLCGLNAQSLKRHLQILIDAGLVKETEIKIRSAYSPCYIFPYDKDGKYELIKRDMLWYLVSTRNACAVKIYTYLLNCYKWKNKQNDTYVFTNKDLLKVIGFSSDNSLASSMISNILESFSREGVLNYVEFNEEHILDTGNTIPTPKKRLLYVSTDIKELRKPNI